MAQALKKLTTQVLKNNNVDTIIGCNAIRASRYVHRFHLEIYVTRGQEQDRYLPNNVVFFQVSLLQSECVVFI